MSLKELFIKPDLSRVIFFYKKDKRVKYFSTPASLVTLIEDSSYILENPTTASNAYGQLAFYLGEALQQNEDLQPPLILHGGSCNLGPSLEIQISEETYGNKGIVDILSDGKEVPGKEIWGVRVDSHDDPGEIIVGLVTVLGRAMEHAQSRRHADRVCDPPEDWDSFPMILFYSPEAMESIIDISGSTVLFSLSTGLENEAIRQLWVLDYPNFY